MNCEKCGDRLRNTSTTTYVDKVARQKICLKCGAVYYTLEETIDDEYGKKMLFEKSKRYRMANVR